MMALPTCPKCDNGYFTLSQITPSGSAFKLFAVCCSSCGAVVATLDYENIGAMLHKQNAAIKKIASAVGVSVDL